MSTRRAKNTQGEGNVDTYLFQVLEETLPRFIPQVRVNLSCPADLQEYLFV